MTDRELLEYAAKAVALTNWQAKTCRAPFRCDSEGVPYWNPLTDDGDALRLAVKLGLNIIGNAVATVSVRAGNDHDVSEVFIQLQRTDYPYAATRRAIVRAAAEIGRSQS
jgi:hypothetical protein